MLLLNDSASDSDFVAVHFSTLLFFSSVLFHETIRGSEVKILLRNSFCISYTKFSTSNE